VYLFGLPDPTAIAYCWPAPAFNPLRRLTKSTAHYNAAKLYSFERVTPLRSSVVIAEGLLKVHDKTFSVEGSAVVLMSLALDSRECFVSTPPHDWLPFLNLVHGIFPDSLRVF